MKTKSSLRIPALLPLASLLAASALPGSAALIAYDTFTGYSAGTLNGQGQGFGWSGNWSGSTDFTVTTSPGLTHASSTGTGGTATTGTSTADAGIDLSRSFLTTLPSVGDVYFGFLMQQPTGNSPHAAALQVNGGTSTAVWAGAWNASSTWRLARVIPTNNYGDVNTAVNESTATVFFVLKMELTAGNDTARLFVNPANAAALTGAGQASYAFSSFAAPTGLNFYRQNAGLADGNVSFDEIRVGTAAADMFSVIPESSTALLGGLGMLALLRRRRS